MTSPVVAEQDPAFLPFLPRFLFVPDRVPERYLAKVWPLAFLPLVALALLATLVGIPHAGPDLPLDTVRGFTIIVLIGPAIETLILAALLLLLDALFGAAAAVLLTAGLAGLAHIPGASVLRGIAIFWPFLIWSVAFLAWRARSAWMGLLVVFAAHALHNLTVLMLIFLAQGVSLPSH
jgi:hypothetical protein